MFTPSKEQIELNEKFAGKWAVKNSSGRLYKISGAHASGDDIILQCYAMKDGKIFGRGWYFKESEMTFQ